MRNSNRSVQTYAGVQVLLKGDKMTGRTKDGWTWVDSVRAYIVRWAASRHSSCL